MWSEGAYRAWTERDPDWLERLKKYIFRVSLIRVVNFLQYVHAKEPALLCDLILWNKQEETWYCVELWDYPFRHILKPFSKTTSLFKKEGMPIVKQKTKPLRQITNYYIVKINGRLATISKRDAFLHEMSDIDLCTIHGKPPTNQWSHASSTASPTQIHDHHLVTFLCATDANTSLKWMLCANT